MGHFGAKNAKNREACPEHGGGSALRVLGKLARQVTLPPDLTEPPSPGVSNSQREQSESNRMWEPLRRFFGIHAVGLRFIRSFEERILVMDVFVNPMVMKSGFGTSQG